VIYKEEDSLKGDQFENEMQLSR